MARKPPPTLPFPFVGDHPSRCIVCGYDLAGVSGRCPECGTGIDGEPGAIFIAAVPKIEEANPWRRTAFIVLAVGVMLLSQFFVLLGMVVGFAIMLVLLAGALLGVGAMIVTSRAKKRSIERIAFTHAGLGRAAWGREFGETFTPWRGDEVLESKHIGSVWQRLTIKAPKPGGLFDTIFECGFRCQREELDWICYAIQAMAHGEPIPDRPEPTDPATDEADTNTISA